MGCVSSKILAKSGSFQDKVSFGHSFQRSSVIEEIILSSASKSNGDQFLALLCSSNSSARKAKEPEAEQSPSAAAEPIAKIETINVSELLADLEEAEQGQERHSGGRKDGDGDRAPAPCASESDGGAAGRARSFRTVKEFDALVTQQSRSSERAPAPATEQQEALEATTSVSSHGGATATAAESRGSAGQDEPAGAAEQGEAAEVSGTGTRRRARARQLGELKVPAACFDFSKSGSLRDWLRQGGQTFSPGSYVTPKFGTAAAAPEEQGGRRGEEAGERRLQEHDALFDPELVAQFERSMEQLSEDEGRVLEEILEALESEAAGEKDEAAAVGIRASGDRPAAGGRRCAAGLAGDGAPARC